MQLFDTHAHLDDERFGEDLPAVLTRAEEAGVRRVITIGVTAASSLASITLAEKHSLLRAAVGIQPNHVAEVADGDWDQIVRMTKHPKVAGIGETGLDRYWDRAPFDQQEDYFARHLELGRRTGKAVIIHCREAEADVLRMLRADFDKHGPVRAVMHSFTGNAETASACLEMGLYISFAGMVTYKSADDLRAVAKTIPVERLLVETDSPYLAPVPVRGKRNEPGFVGHTACFLAELRGMKAEKLGDITTRNAESLFGL